MPEISEQRASAIIHERNVAVSKIDRIKDEAKAGAAKAGGALCAIAVGGMLGVLNTQQGGTPSTPYQIAGSVPLDIAAGAAGLVALLMTRKSAHLPYVAGAAYGALGIVGYRYGAQYEPQLFGASSSASQQATTPAATTPAATSQPTAQTSQGVVGTLSGHGQRHNRLPGQYGTRTNPYMQSFSARPI